MADSNKINPAESRVRIIFDDSTKELILEALGKTTDTENYIVEKENTKERVITFEGKELKYENFGGVEKGSEIFIEDNLPSLINLIKAKG
jgi:hypothetical protein